MSLSYIETLIKESFRSGELSQSDKEFILKEGETLGISSRIILELIEDHASMIFAQKKGVEQLAIEKAEASQARKIEFWNKMMRDLTVQWIRQNPQRILDREDYFPDICKQANKFEMDLVWVETWIEEIERQEQEIAGIKPNTLRKWLNKFPFLK